MARMLKMRRESARIPRRASIRRRLNRKQTAAQASGYLAIAFKPPGAIARLCLEEGTGFGAA
jgi:hypothetical protein